MEPIFGPAGDVDATEAYLFEGDDGRLFAVSRDRTGANIPTNLTTDGWSFRQGFELGVREALPFASNPEPILRGLRSLGFYIWREGPVRNPSGTSQ
jgi:hypothetical protein